MGIWTFKTILLETFKCPLVTPWSILPDGIWNLSTKKLSLYKRKCSRFKSSLQVGKYQNGKYKPYNENGPRCCLLTFRGYTANTWEGWEGATSLATWQKTAGRDYFSSWTNPNVVFLLNPKKMLPRVLQISKTNPTVPLQLITSIIRKKKNLKLP